jgi:hypothetical protein
MNKRLLTLAANGIAETTIGREWSELDAFIQDFKDEHIAAAKHSYSEHSRKRYGRIIADCEAWLAAAKALKDPPIADPVERAKTTAEELRNRGIRAKVHGHHGIMVWFGESGYWYHMAHEGVAAMGPRALADRIQASEAKRAHEWAGEK